MKILLVTTDIDRSELHLFKRMHEAGLEVHAICNPEAPYYQELAKTGIHLIPLRIRHRIQPGAIAAIRKLLDTCGIDVVHALRKSALSNAIIAAYKTPVKIVTYRGAIGGLSFLDFRSWLSFLSPRVDKIICVAEGVRRYLLSLGLLGLKVPEGKLVTIPKGHDIAWYAHHDDIDLSAFGIPQGVPIIGCVAAMRPRKGVDVLIKAMDLLPDRLGNAHLVLVGQVKDRKIVRARENGKSRDRIHLTGNLPHKQCLALVAKMNLFVLPAIKPEGLPRAVIEAMAQGVPAVVTDVPGSADLVQDFVDGRTVEPNDPRALAEAITHMLDDREQLQAYGMRARRKIEEHFNIRATVDRTMAVYRELLERAA